MISVSELSLNECSVDLQIFCLLAKVGALREPVS